MIAFALTAHAILVSVGALLAAWLGPALLTWLTARPRVSPRDALLAPGTLTLTGIVLVVVVCVLASTS